jgi:zinc protease
MSRRSIIAALLAVLGATPALADNKPAAKPAPPKPAADPWAGRRDLFVPPVVKPSTKVDLGAVERYTLPNGLQVIAVPRHNAPVIDLLVGVRVDEEAEPLDKIGVANFTAAMLRKGTQKRSADQISDQIDFVGGELDAEVGEHGPAVACRARSRDLTLCLDLASDILIRPIFPEKEMGEIRDQLVASVEQTRDNPGLLAREHAHSLYFGDEDPRGRPMSKRTIAAIDRAALVAFHKTWFAPNNAVLAISGDFDPKAMRAALTKWFGPWKKTEVPKLASRPLPPAGPMKVRLVDKPDATQSQIVVVGPGIKHADPDLCSTRLMDYALGGGSFSSRLMKVVRSDNAKSYGARSTFEATREPGVFSASTFTRDGETSSTTKLVLGEIEHMRAGGPTEAELAAAKSNMIGGYGLHFETGADVARQLIVAKLDDLPDDFAVTYPKCLETVTLADATKAAASHLHPQALVIVGPAKSVAPQLAAAKLTPSETILYTDPVSAAERKLAAGAKDQAKKEAAAAPAAEIEEGKKLLQLALKAKGADGIARITDLHINATGQLSAGGQNQPIGFEGFYAPGRGQREDVRVMGQVMSQVFVDGKGFMKVAMQAKDLPPDMSAALRRDLWRNPSYVVLSATQPGTMVRRLPQVTDGKLKLDALQVVSPEGDSLRLLLDPATHQVARVVYTEDGKETRQDLSEYKPEAGISFARKIVTQGEGERMEITIDNVQVNKGLPKDTFAR